MAPLRLLPAIALLALSGVTAAAGQSPPAGLKCGDTITADTTLDRDLSDCPSNGILIGADGITLDLNGHTISGNGKLVRRCGRREICDVGVANDDHTGVTIRNGSVRRFAIGVGVMRVRDNRLVKLTSSENQFFGFLIAGSARTVIRDSTGIDNPAPDGDGLGVFGSHDLRIVGNSFRRNAQLGMHIEDSSENLVKGNVFVRNGDFGILMEGDDNQLRANRSVRDGVAAIQVGPGSRNVIVGNRIHRSGEGIGLEKTRGTVVARNVVVSVRHDGIRLGMWDPPLGNTRTVVRRNLVVDSGRDGFRVAQRDIDALLVGNVARRSADDGFDIDSPSARLRANRAVASGDLDVDRP
jgi:parallel beta-helix repeat protein